MIDNSAWYFDPYQRTLEADGYEVTFAKTVSEAETALSDGNYNLVVLDVMMPISAADEAQGYSSVATDAGRRTGLAFYIRNRSLLVRYRIPVMVMSVRLDQSIQDAFVAAGLPSSCFFTKFALRDVRVFLETVRLVINSRKT